MKITEYTNINNKIAADQSKLNELNEENTLNSTSEIKNRDFENQTSLSKFKIILILCLVLAIVILSYVYLYGSKELRAFVQNLETSLNSFYLGNPICFLIISYFVMAGIVTTCIGSFSLYCILISTIIQNFTLSFVVLFMGAFTGDIFACLIVKYSCRDWLTSKFKSNDLYLILVEESVSKPYKTAFLTRLIMIPAGFKNYILLLIKNPFKSYILSGLFIHFIAIGESCLIAHEITEVYGIIESNNGWKEKSTTQKFSFILMIVLICVSFIILVSVGYWAVGRIKEKRRLKEARELEQKNANAL
jgi:uncharacterized membrane protein YdjX (TVP38/TMEM64 family)